MRQINWRPAALIGYGVVLLATVLGSPVAVHADPAPPPAPVTAPSEAPAPEAPVWTGDYDDGDVWIVL